MTELNNLECATLLTREDVVHHRDSENMYIVSSTKHGQENEVLGLSPLVSSIRCSGELIASGSTGKELLEEIQSLQPIVEDQWSIYFECLQTSNKKSEGKSKKGFSSKTIMCGIANILRQGTFSLDPDCYTDIFGIFETSTGLHLVRIDQSNPIEDNFERHKKSWARRPFQYSASLSFDASVCAVNILRCMVLDRFAPYDEKTLLDPCCGAGTNLITARRVGFRTVVGMDINPNCIDGCMQNLRHENLLEEENVILDCVDSTLHLGKDKSGDCAVHAVIANLPWGNNAKDYYGQNTLILEKVRKRVATGTPCIFISHITQDLENSLRKDGWFEIVHIVPFGSGENMYICVTM